MHDNEERAWSDEKLGGLQPPLAPLVPTPVILEHEFRAHMTPLGVNGAIAKCLSPKTILWQSVSCLRIKTERWCDKYRLLLHAVLTLFAFLVILYIASASHLLALEIQIR